MSMFKKVLLATVGSVFLGFGSVSQAASESAYFDGVKSAMSQDYGIAYEKFIPLAKAGDGRAMFNLALMYHGGLFVEFNEPMAVSLYQEAAAKGVVEAQQFLAMGYQEGWFGLPQDPVQAAYWYHKFQ